LFLESIPKFESYLKDQDLLHSSIIFDRLLLKSPKIAEELLNAGINSNHDTEDKTASEATVLSFDFGLFRPQRPNTFDSESLPMCRMLEEGQRDLIKQPLTEAFIYLKWQKLCWAFYLSFIYRILLAFVVTLAAFAEVSRHPVLVRWAPKTRPGLLWLLVAFYFPSVLQLVFSVARLRLAFFLSSWVQLKRPCPPVPLPSLTCLVQFGLLTSIGKNHFN
jgi:hypothetical protein